MHWRTTTKESDLKQWNTLMRELMCSVCFSRRTQCSLTLSGWASLRRKWESWKTSWTMSPGGEKLNWLLCCPSLSFYAVLLRTSLGPHLRNTFFCLWYFNPHLFSRLWRDVTLNLKLKDIDSATEAKHRLEEKQRAEARERKENEQQWETRVRLSAHILHLNTAW